MSSQLLFPHYQQFVFTQIKFSEVVPQCVDSKIIKPSNSNSNASRVNNANSNSNSNASRVSNANNVMLKRRCSPESSSPPSPQSSRATVGSNTTISSTVTPNKMRRNAPGSF